MRLRTNCNSIDIQTCKKNEGPVRVYQLQALEAGAEHRCSFCQFLRDTFTTEIEEANHLLGKAGCLFLYMFSNGHRWAESSLTGLHINEMRISISQGYWGVNPRLHFRSRGDQIPGQHTLRVLADIGSFPVTPYSERLLY